MTSYHAAAETSIAIELNDPFLIALYLQIFLQKACCIFSQFRKVQVHFKTMQNNVDFSCSVVDSCCITK